MSNVFQRHCLLHLSHWRKPVSSRRSGSLDSGFRRNDCFKTASHLVSTPKLMTFLGITSYAISSHLCPVWRQAGRRGGCMATVFPRLAMVLDWRGSTLPPTNPNHPCDRL